MNGYKNFRIGDLDAEIYEDGEVCLIDGDGDIVGFNKQVAIDLAHVILNHFMEDTE